jgi:hypothetical protein
MLPIKMFKNYTIALDSPSAIELCCGIYGDYQDTRDRFKNLPKSTYQRINYSQFSKPFLYTKLSYENLIKEFGTTIKDANNNVIVSNENLIEVAKNECDLKLFIKIPANNNSSIVVLEGNYCG